MNRPDPMTLLAGRSLIALPIVIGCVIVIIGAFNGGVPLIVGIVAFLLLGATINANRKATEYKNWKQQWDAMGGQAAPPKPTPGLRTLHVVVASIVLVAGLLFALGDAGSGHPKYILPDLLYFMGVIAIAVRFMIRRRSRRPKKSASGGTEEVITVSPVKSVNSPDMKQIYQDLPDYVAQMNKK